MRRRNFLKVLGLASAGAVFRLPIQGMAASAAPKAVSSGGRLYRSDGSGRVFVSLDKGKSWSTHSDLGPAYAVTQLTVDRGDRLHATVGYQAWNFALTLAPNLHSWLTT